MRGSSRTGFVLLEHLLLALTDDPEAAIILESANVDLLRLRADVSGYLGRLLEDMRAEPGVEPRPDPELLRVLQAAASAAQQSRRRHIDGAIVLAAIVGDGKSPAAGLLKTLGMTFEGAIRALQRANAQARFRYEQCVGCYFAIGCGQGAPSNPSVKHAPAVIAEMPNDDAGQSAQLWRRPPPMTSLRLLGRVSCSVGPAPNLRLLPGPRRRRHRRLRPPSRCLNLFRRLLYHPSRPPQRAHRACGSSAARASERAASRVF